MSCTLIVSDVTARRSTAWESASALMIRGTSASSGRSLLMRETASRMSDAATSRSAPSPNSTVSRLLPKDELDEMDFTPATRETAPSSKAVSSRSIVSAEAPGKLAEMVMTGRSTFGSSRISTPNRAARPATAINVLTTKAKTGRLMNSAVMPLSDRAGACSLTARFLVTWAGYDPLEVRRFSASLCSGFLGVPPPAMNTSEPSRTL